MNKKLLSILVANLCVAAPALAQQDVVTTGSVTLGGFVNNYKDDGNPAKLFEYRDLDDGVLFNFDLRGRGSRYWFDAFGQNIGRVDQGMGVKGGAYDSFKYSLYSETLPHVYVINARSPFAGSGTADPRGTLPALDWTKWYTDDIKIKRRDDGGVIEVSGGMPFYLRFNANQVTTTGARNGSSSNGTSPTNGFTDLAFPIDYRTTNFGAELGYNTKTMHLAGGYQSSKFTSGEQTIRWNNGFWFGTNPGNLDQTYLAPDNDYERWFAEATFRQLPLNSTFAIRGTMDELTSSTNLGTTVLNGTGFTANAPTLPNTPTFNGKVENKTVAATLASRPMAGLDTRIYYNYFKKRNESTHVVFSGASAGCEAGCTPEHLSYTKDNFGIDAQYRLDKANRFAAGWDYVKVDRERFDFDENKDNKFYAEWKNTSLEALSARLKYTHLQRRSNFLLGNDGVNANDVLYWNRFLKAYDLANVNQDQVKLVLDYNVAPYFDLSFEGVLKENKFRDQTLGRLKDERTELYASASWGRPDELRLTLFVDYEEVKYKSQHRVVGSATATTPPGPYDPNLPPTSANYNWQGTTKDKNLMLGLSADWPALPNLLVKASVLYVDANGSVDFSSQPGPALPPANIGNYDDSTKTSVNLKGIYTVDKNWTVTGGYSFEKYEFKDAAYDGYRYLITAANNANSYLSGAGAFLPYKANIFYVLGTYKF